MRIYLKECYVQKTNQFDALEVWKQLDMGCEIDLCFDKKGENVIARLHKDCSKVIGQLPKDESESLEPYLEVGWNKFDDVSKKIIDVLFSGRISRFDEKADENKRISIAIFIEDYNLSRSKSNANKVK